MKKLLLLVAAVFVWLGVQSQGTLPYNDDFESYTVGGFLASQSPTWWTTWSNAPGTGEDGQISSAFAHSGTKSVVVDEVGGATDQIMKLGNKVSGAYELKWWMYVETDKSGYYNIQHYQSPGIQWACEIYFRTSGAGELFAGSSTAFAFTYPKAQWFEVKHLIDIDNDNIKFYINGALIKEWPFHYQASGTTGLNQLGGVDLFAGGSGTDVPKFFFDDVSFSSYVPAADPIIGVSPTSLSATLQTGQTTVQQLTVSNTGVANLNYNAYVILNSDAPGVTPMVITNENTHSQTASLGNCSFTPTSGAGKPQTDATGILHYDGDNASAIGWNSPPITVTVAARFPNNMTLPFAGMYLNSVDVFVNDLNTTGSNLMTVKVYGSGLSYEPGELITSQTFTPAGAAWETITLSSPVLITGQDLWIGYTFTQTDANIFIPGTDAGPNDPNGDFLSTGVGWSHLSNNPTLLRNWNIRGNLSGDLFPQWISVNPTSGTVIPSGSQTIDVTFNSANLSQGTYQGIVRLWSNDPATPQVDVPVTLEVVASACPPPTSLAVSTITNSSAAISWVGAAEVEIDYGAAGHAAGSGTILSGIYFSPYTLAGLASLTTYDVYVRQVCGIGNVSPWAGPLNFTTLEQYITTLYPPSVTNATGYVTNGSFLKKGPWMNITTTLNDTSGRAYVKFDVSSLPANAIITKLTLGYYNFAREGTSGGLNYVYSLANDPVTTAGALLHTDCGDGAPLWTGAWGGTAPTWFTSPLNAAGISYVTDQLAAGWAGFGITRSSSFLYRMTGYNDATYKPYLAVEYHVATTPVYSVSPASKDFEQINLGIQSAPQSFKIKNAGVGTIMVDAVALDGVDASQYILTDGAVYPKILGAGASYTVSVVFKPTSTGVKTASLRVTENETDHYVALTGTGYLNGPQNLSATPVMGPYVNLAWEVLPLHEIRYDDNSAETFYWVGTPSATTQYFYTRITIPTSGTLTNFSVLARANGATTFTSVSLCPDLNGTPNLASPIQSFSNVPVTSTTGQWIIETLTSPLAVTAGQEYYIVTQWPAGSLVGPYVGTDTYSNHYRSGYSSNGGASWSTFPYTLFMRAYMTVPGDNLTGGRIELTSGKEVEGLKNLPTLAIGDEPKRIANPLSIQVPGIVAPSTSNRSLTDFTVNRGTVSGTWTTTFSGVTGTTFQDNTTLPTTLYYYMVTANYTNGAANSNITSVTTFEVCPVPTALTATGITSTAASLSWNGNGTTAWEIEWGVTGFTPGSGAFITTGVTNPYSLTGLAGGTSYTYYVRSNCGGGSFSSWGGPYSFMTVCGSFPAPITETFEGATFAPACWSRTATASTWERSTDASGYGIGTASAFADFYNFPAATTFDLITLNFNTGSLYQPVLKFDYAYATYSATYVDQMDVYYSTDAGTTYTLLLAMPGGTTGILNTGGTAADPFIPTSAQWATQTLPLPAGTNMIKFTATSAYGNDLYLDNVKIEATPIPENITVTGQVGTGETVCYNATNTITVGGASPWVVAAGGSATLIAGVKIIFLPGAAVLSGGYMHGYISTTYCSPTDAPMMAAGTTEPTPTVVERPSFSIYPNPTTGNFTLVQKGSGQFGNVKVEIFSMRGERVLASQMIGEQRHEFVTADLPSGLYFVKLVADDYTETIKLIKTR